MTDNEKFESELKERFGCDEPARECVPPVQKAEVDLLPDGRIGGLREVSDYWWYDTFFAPNLEPDFALGCFANHKTTGKREFTNNKLTGVLSSDCTAVLNKMVCRVCMPDALLLDKIEASVLLELRIGEKPTVSLPLLPDYRIQGQSEKARTYFIGFENTQLPARQCFSVNVGAPADVRRWLVWENATGFRFMQVWLGGKRVRPIY